MHPLCFSLGELRVTWYGVMMASGFIAGLLNWVWLGRKEGRDFNFCSDLLFWTMVAGVVGARTAYVLSDIGYFMEDPVGIFRIWKGGLIYYGGFIAAVGTLAVFARAHKLKVLALFDFAATSLPLAHVFGRIGCLLNGCCHGTLFKGPWAVTYPRESLPWHQHQVAGLIENWAERSASVHPVQVYEALINLAVYLLLITAFRRRTRDGQVTALYLLTYPVGRFMVEFFRGDQRMEWVGLTVAQVVSMVLVALGAALWVKSRSGEPVVPGAGVKDDGKQAGSSKR